MDVSRKRSFHIFLVVLVIICFAIYLYDIDYSKISKIVPDFRLLFFASLVALGFRYWGVIIWRRILRDLGTGKLPSFRYLANIYAKAWMGRYIPGKVAWIAGKVYLAGSIGIAKSRLTVASLLEAVVQITAITVTSLLLIGLDSRADDVPALLKLLSLGFGLSFLIFLHPKIFNYFVPKIYRLISKKEPSDQLKINGKAVSMSFILFSIGTFISGISYFLLTLSLTDSVSWDSILYLVGVFGFAGAVGMAVPFLPSGIGVRDGVQLLLLTAIMPKETAIVIVVYGRLWSSIIDLIFVGLAFLLNLDNKSSKMVND